MPAKKASKSTLRQSVASSASQSELNQTKAIVSLVLGIAGLVLFWVPLIGLVLGIVALVLGLKAKKDAEQQPSVYGGKGLALAGLILGIISTVLGLLYLIYWIFIMLFIGSMMTQIY